MSIPAILREHPMAQLIRSLSLAAVLAWVLGVSALSAETVDLVASKTSGVAINETVTVRLILADGAPFNAFQGYLQWDKAHLELVSNPTTALLTSGGVAFPASDFDLTGARDAGFGLRRFTSTGNDISPVNATLMTWTFRAIAPGETVVRMHPYGYFTKLVNKTGVTRYPPVGRAWQGMPIIILPPTVNAAPKVSAGPDQTIPLRGAADLSMTTISDDGLPSSGIFSYNQSFTYKWTKISGPGTATFSEPTWSTSSATFSAAGTYVLQLEVGDGELSASDQVTVTVIQTNNNPPMVDAGMAQSILQNTATLVGKVTDDGLPTPATLTRTWTLLNGPGTVTFSAPSAATTTATFSSAGHYRLLLSANDGALTGAATIWVSVLSNARPIVDLGPDLAINLLEGAYFKYGVADDGLPEPWTQTRTWTKVTGPGTVTFSDQTYSLSSGQKSGNDLVLSSPGPGPSATFSVGGIYDVQLAVSDGALTGTDVVRVTVNTEPTVNAGPDQAISLPATATLTGTVTDDGLPAPATLTRTWTRISGPGTATFSAPNAATTTATFSVAGTYVLELAANDGASTTSDQVTVTANPAATGGTGGTPTGSGPGGGSSGGGGCGLGSAFAALLVPGLLLIRRRRSHS